jgi:hypothetical protein
MITVYKYTFDITDTQKLRIHADCEFLRVDVQHDIPCLWAMVNTNKPIIDYDILIVGTGHEVKSWETLKHIGSFQHKDRFVWHVFHELPF